MGDGPAGGRAHKTLVRLQGVHHPRRLGRRTRTKGLDHAGPWEEGGYHVWSHNNVDQTVLLTALELPLGSMSRQAATCFPPEAEFDDDVVADRVHQVQPVAADATPVALRISLWDGVPPLAVSRPQP